MKLLKFSSPDKDVQYNWVFPETDEDIKKLKEMLYLKGKNVIQIMPSFLDTEKE